VGFLELCKFCWHTQTTTSTTYGACTLRLTLIKEAVFTLTFVKVSPTHPYVGQEGALSKCLKPKCLTFRQNFKTNQLLFITFLKFFDSLLHNFLNPILQAEILVKSLHYIAPCFPTWTLVGTKLSLVCYIEADACIGCGYSHD